jgi:hypothetical protein
LSGATEWRIGESSGKRPTRLRAQRILNDLVSIVNFGAPCGFLLLHVSVIVQFWVKGRSGQWIVHLAIPLAGSIVVRAVLSEMSSMALGLTWLAVGLVYGAVLVSRRRAELAI